MAVRLFGPHELLFSCMTQDGASVGYYPGKFPGILDALTNMAACNYATLTPIRGDSVRFLQSYLGELPLSTVR